MKDKDYKTDFKKSSEYWIDTINSIKNQDLKNEITNGIIRNTDTNKISDGYHTFGELYNHRTRLWIELCRGLDKYTNKKVWCSKVHSDGKISEGFFLLGCNMLNGKQITYHLEDKYWDECAEFAEILKIAPQ